ncbi:MAG: YfcC family protein [Candidatus Aminicenantes bacterium]|nr:YfcC family protein [Candidatus Aminicenantes bacterium]
MKKKNKSLKLPHTLVLIYILVVSMYIMTWIIPSGQFERVDIKVENTVRTVTKPGTFKYIEKKTVGPEALLIAPIKGFGDGALIIAFLFIIGGAFAVIQATGTIDMAIKKLTGAFSSRPKLQKLIIPVLMVVFSFAGGVFGMCEETIPFVLIFIPLSLSLGYDSIVGVAIPFLGAAAGFAAAFFNPFTVGIAQGISGLPIYSGLSYRLFAWVVGTTVIIAFVMVYANKIKKNPKLSPVYELDRQWVNKQESDNIDTSQWTWRNRAILEIFGGGILILVVGVLMEQWYIEPIAAVFMAMGIICGFVGRMNSSDIAKNFVLGAKDMVTVALIIACSRAILVIANQGQILDTMLLYASQAISVFPKIVVAQMMFVVQSIINFFIHSGTAQAALTMPIMSPLSDLVGITQQTSVFAFQLCEFVNPILPTSAVTMGVLGMAKIPYEKWARWFLPLLLILFVLSFLLLIPPVLTNWGPF